MVTRRNNKRGHFNVTLEGKGGGGGGGCGTLTELWPWFAEYLSEVPAHMYKWLTDALTIWDLYLFCSWRRRRQLGWVLRFFASCSLFLFFRGRARRRLKTSRGNDTWRKIVKDVQSINVDRQCAHGNGKKNQQQQHPRNQKFLVEVAGKRQLLIEGKEQRRSVCGESLLLTS